MLYYLLVGPVAIVTATSPVQATRGGGNEIIMCARVVYDAIHTLKAHQI